MNTPGEPQDRPFSPKIRYVAFCHDCNWHEGLFMHKHAAEKAAASHASQYGHETTVEMADLPEIDPSRQE